MTTIKNGSIWSSSDKTFQVIETVDIDGQTWVHYREHAGTYTPVKECKEYSCLLESFVFRFRQSEA